MQSRLGGFLVVMALVLLAVPSGDNGLAHASRQAQAQALTIDGEVALWTMSIKPDKTADFERIMAKLRDALINSAEPGRKQQAAGWKVMKVDKPLPDGNIAYVHIINPVSAGADYSVMQTLYDAFPDERQALYEAYRGAFAQNLSLAAGRVVLDMTKPQ
jgi:hypothetical protein